MLDLLINVDRKRLLSNLAAPVDRPMLTLTLTDILTVTASFFKVSHFVTVPFMPMDPTTWPVVTLYLLGGGPPDLEIYNSEYFEKYILAINLGSTITILADQENPIQRKARKGVLSLNNTRLITLLGGRERVKLRMLIRVKITGQDLITMLDTPIVVNNDSAFYQVPLLAADGNPVLKHPDTEKLHKIEVTTESNNAPQLGVYQ
jgi:hypothetical protein